MVVLGIDPGTSRWAYVFLDDGEVIDEGEFPTQKVIGDPSLITNLFSKADLSVAPSGYGTELKKLSDLTCDDYFEILLKKDKKEASVGLESVLRELAKRKENAYVLPGVKLLPTVSVDKKQGKIDMGTPDKLCVAVAGIVDQANRRKICYTDTEFILAEIGYGFDAFVAVCEGQIVNGIGGTLASSTWRGADGELLYLMGKVKKEELKKGMLPLDQVAQGAFKDITELQEDVNPKEILLSGSRCGYISDFLTHNFKNVRRLKTAGSSNAAFGAAVIADGLSGGTYAELVDLLRIKEASGSNLDYTNLK